MTKLTTKSILAAGTLALAAAVSCAAPAPRASVAWSPDPASTALLPGETEALALPCRSSLAGAAAAPHDDDPDSGDGGEGDDGGDDESGSQG